MTFIDQTSDNPTPIHAGDMPHTPTNKFSEYTFSHLTLEEVMKLGDPPHLRVNPINFQYIDALNHSPAENSPRPESIAFTFPYKGPQLFSDTSGPADSLKAQDETKSLVSGKQHGGDPIQTSRVEGQNTIVDYKYPDGMRMEFTFPKDPTEPSRLLIDDPARNQKDRTVFYPDGMQMHFTQKNGLTTDEEITYPTDADGDTYSVHRNAKGTHEQVNNHFTFLGVPGDLHDKYKDRVEEEERSYVLNDGGGNLP